MTNPLDSAGDDGSDQEDTRWIVRLTEYARADIDAATAYLAGVIGDERADAWQNGLLEAAGRLARFPMSHGTIPELALFQETIRQFWYTGNRRARRGGPAWRILFALRPNEKDGAIIQVLHVRHGAQGPMTAEEAQTIERSR